MEETAPSRRLLLATTFALALAGTLRQQPVLADDFKMGLLVPGSIGEEGWNRIASDALKWVEKDLDATISHVELRENPAAFEKAFRDYAGQGYDAVLGHGFRFQDAALTAAEDFPDTVFLISSSHVHQGKVIGLNTDASQPFCRMGAIAAKMGKRAGLIGGMEIPPIAQTFEGFRNGARSVNADVPVSIVYLGSFTDASAAKEAAFRVISQGAATFSVYSDYTRAAPQNVLGTFLADYGQSIVGIKNGKVPESNVDFGLKDIDVIRFTYDDGATRSVPADLHHYIEEVSTKIVSGEIQTRAK
ncbi:BMP family protein [Shinella sp.]|uniref:BMP family protein n=1 Tax=Shinella sp. TaxID=1870904 RepID=UPI00301E21D8